MLAWTEGPESTVDNRTDAELTRLTVAGDEDARAALDRRLDDRLPRWVRRWSSSTVWREDLAGAAKDRIRSRLKNYNRARGSFNSWAYKVAYRAVIDKVRTLHLGQQEFSFDALPDEALLTAAEPGDDYRACRTREEVDGLSPELAKIIRLRFYDRLSLVQIARVLHLTRKQARLRMQKAMLLLRRRLGCVASISQGPFSCVQPY